MRENKIIAIPSLAEKSKIDWCETESEQIEMKKMKGFTDDLQDILFSLSDPWANFPLAKSKFRANWIMLIQNPALRINLVPLSS